MRLIIITLILYDEFSINWNRLVVPEIYSGATATRSSRKKNYFCKRERTSECRIKRLKQTK
ncbi:hypothetical protein Hanom_Chr16g01415391 [Helianthus anomalus]